MIKEKELNNDLERIAVGRVCSLAEARSDLLSMAQENSIPITLDMDSVKTKGFLHSQEIPCLVISHPDHRNDYYKIVLLIGDGEIMTGTTGVSKQMKKFDVSEANRQMRKGKSMSFKIGNLVANSLLTLGKNKEKLAQETAYYETIFAMIGACFEVQ